MTKAKARKSKKKDTVTTEIAKSDYDWIKAESERQSQEQGQHIACRTVIRQALRHHPSYNNGNPRTPPKH